MLMLLVMLMLMLICVNVDVDMSSADVDMCDVCVFCCFESITYKYHLHKYPSLNCACYNQALRDMNISMSHIPCLQYVEARFSEE